MLINKMDFRNFLLLLVICYLSSTLIPPAFGASHQECSGEEIIHLDTGDIFDSGQEIGLGEYPSNLIYGNDRNEKGVVHFPECPRARDSHIVIPVFLVDWKDFEPSINISNPNNPTAPVFSEYKKKSPENISAWLNGPSGPAEYFKDVSGGQLRLRFEVFGWIQSGSEHGYLKNRKEYIFQNSDNQRWYCQKKELMRDVMREAVVGYNVDFTQYDIDKKSTPNSPGVIDNMVLLYEGGPAICSGTNADNFPSTYSNIIPENGDSYKGVQLENISTLVQIGDPNYSDFKNQNIYYNPYNNIPEYDSKNLNNEYDLFMWTHELGHEVLGFDDYYRNSNMGTWGISSSTVKSKHAKHPGAWEKALFGGWINYKEIIDSGGYTIKSSDIPDNEQYENFTYIYKIPVGEDEFISVEYRWLEGNDNTQWSSNGFEEGYLGQLESGLQIIYHNFNRQAYEEQPQIFRFDEAPEEWEKEFFAYTGDDEFNKCFNEHVCISISNIQLQNDIASFVLSASLIDTDGDGVSDRDDAFPLDATETVDTDNDGIGNNADTDDDGDGIEDSADAFPLDATETVDSDNDGIGNNADTDDDGDGVEDSDDAFPLDATESVDTDGDGIGNNTDTDDDGDGVNDSDDAFPLDATESVDTDGDGIGNNTDTDDDGDGVNDSNDAFPLDSSRSVAPETQKVNSSGGGGSLSAFLFLLLFMSIMFKKVSRISKTPNSLTT